MNYETDEELFRKEQEAAVERANQRQASEDNAAAGRELLENAPEMRPPNFSPVQQVVEVGKELNRAVKGGLKDTVSSVITAPERTKDMFSGEMAAQGKDYAPTFDPLDSLDYRTSTWWGEMARTITHYGTLGAGVGVAASGAAGISATTAAASKAMPFLAKSGLVGAGADFLSEYNQDANLLATMRDRFGWLDTPLSTKDTDHPAVKTFKQVVEGFGIGSIAGKLFQSIGKARKGLSKKAPAKPDRAALESVDKINEVKRSRAEDAAKVAVDKNLRAATAQNAFKNGVDFEKLDPTSQTAMMIDYKAANKGKFETWSPPGEDGAARAERKVKEADADKYEQQLEAAQLELNFDDPGAYKNKPMMDIQQGNAFSRGTAYDVAKQSKRIAKEYGSEMGSTDNIITPAAAERIADAGFGDKSINQIVAKQFYGDERTKALIEELRLGNKKPSDVFSYAEEKAMEIVNGRETPDLPPKDYWQALYEDQNLVSDEFIWKSENVVTADLVNASLFTKLRNLAISSREVFDYLDVTDLGGPVKHIRDNLIVGLTETKRARYVLSEAFRRLQKENPLGSKFDLEKKMAEIHGSTRDQVDMMLEIAKTAPTDDLLRGVLEAFSMSNSIHNWTDFDAYIRKALMGETLEGGRKKTGLMVRELQGVMINSVLSGPKTPLRAIMGTSTAAFLRPMSQVVGGALQYAGSGFTDAATIRSGLAQLHAMSEAVPEAARYFMTRMNSYFSGDLSTIKNRFAEYDPRDEQWAMLDFRINETGSFGDKVAFGLANLARGLNQNGFLTYSSKLMSSTDDALTMIMARARAKQKAIEDAFAFKADGTIPEITPGLIKEIEAREYAEIFDPVTGTVSDKMLDVARKEATLTTELGDTGQTLNKFFDSVPILKPFFLFARTGINGMKFTLKHAPGINAISREVRAIHFAKPENLDTVAQYGINTAQELANAKAIMQGRMVIGSAVTFMAQQAYMKGMFTGNGPRDTQTRNTWLATGWQPRSIKLGDAWISYDSFEPFNNVLAFVADLGDMQKQMGPEWADQHLTGQALLLAKGAVSKTYLQGIQMLMDAFSDGSKWEKMAASMANNTLPLSSLRNEIGRFINPMMRELNNSMEETVRNRNSYLEFLAGEELPVKHDILNGEIIRDWDVPTRLFNMISPVQLNFGDSPGRQLLRNSGYDMRMSVYSTPGSPTVKLDEHPKVRSLFQKAIGEQKVRGSKNLEEALDKLSKDPEIQKSIAQMNQDRNLPGGKKIDPMKYPHNVRIKKLIDSARAQAWGRLRNDPEVVKLLSIKVLQTSADRNRQVGNFDEANRKQQQSQSLLEIYR